MVNGRTFQAHPFRGSREFWAFDATDCEVNFQPWDDFITLVKPDGSSEVAYFDSLEEARAVYRQLVKPPKPRKGSGPSFGRERSIDEESFLRAGWEEEEERQFEEELERREEEWQEELEQHNVKMRQIALEMLDARAKDLKEEEEHRHRLRRSQMNYDWEQFLITLQWRAELRRQQKEREREQEEERQNPGRSQGRDRGGYSR